MLEEDSEVQTFILVVNGESHELDVEILTEISSVVKGLVESETFEYKIDEELGEEVLEQFLCICNAEEYEITDDNEMISADVIADIFGVEVKKETNMVTVDINGKQAIFVKGDKIVGFGNEKFDSGIEVYEENGTIFIPMKTLTQFIGKTTSSYEGVTTITTRYVELINNKNIVTAVKGAFEKLMEITVK